MAFKEQSIMYEINSDSPFPAKLSDRSERVGKHSILRGTALALEPGQSFQVPCASEQEKINAMRALRQFRLAKRLQSCLAITSTGPTSFGVWRR